MTSTSVFQGNHGGKPSSRVIRPPGGGSSNIFGVPEEKPAPPAAAPAAESATACVTTEPSWADAVVVRNLADGDKAVPEIPSASNPPAEICSNKSKRGGGFNPITGEAYGEPAGSAKPHASIAVKQPPGGVSTKLW
jgi:hypothetical protein